MVEVSRLVSLGTPPEGTLWVAWRVAQAGGIFGSGGRLVSPAPHVPGAAPLSPPDPPPPSTPPPASSPLLASSSLPPLPLELALPLLPPVSPDPLEPVPPAPLLLAPPLLDDGPGPSPPPGCGL